MALKPAFIDQRLTGELLNGKKPFHRRDRARSAELSVYDGRTCIGLLRVRGDQVTAYAVTNPGTYDLKRNHLTKTETVTVAAKICTSSLPS